MFTSAPRYNLDFAPTKSKADFTSPGLPAFLHTKLHDPDPSIPETKDLRKFVRRMPKLKSLMWTGRGGKGEWTFAKKTTLVSVSFTHAAVLSRRDWEICQLAPPFFEYEEPSTTKPTLLELPPATPTIASSPIAEFPSLSRTSTNASMASVSTRAAPLTPGSPTHSKSLAIKEVNSRLQGLGITEEEGDSMAVMSGKTRHRRETTDGSLKSFTNANSNTDIAQGTSPYHGHGRSKPRQSSLDLSKTTKRLVIGGSANGGTGESTRGSFSPPGPAPLASAPITLKTTSAPTRARASMADTRSPPASATSQKRSSEKSSGGAGPGSKAGKSGKSNAPRQSK